MSALPGGSVIPATRTRLLIMLAPIALAFADASIVVLALPQIVARLHTSIDSVVLVIVVYNAALIVGALAVRSLAPESRGSRLLLGGLLLFGSTSLGSGLAPSLHWLLLFRAGQGLGGGVLLCASLPQLAAACGPDQSPLTVWAAAAAVGAALGPAAGGLLTQVFDWRAIFLAQAPVAAASALAIWLLVGPGGATAAAPRPVPDAVAPKLRHVRLGTATALPIGPVLANVALALLSAGLIGALFMVTLLLIDAWGFTPLAAAAMLTILPVLTAATERLGRKLTVAERAAGGATTLGVGLLALSVVDHRQPGLAVGALVLCGVGLGLAFPALTEAAMQGGRHQMHRVSLTVAARDAGLVVGLLVLTPIFVTQLNAVQKRALPPIAKAILRTPVPSSLQLQLGVGLLHAEAIAPASELPDLTPPFAAAEARSDPASRRALARLKPDVQTIIVNEATRAFRRPLVGSAIFSLLVLPVLLARRRMTRRRSATWA
jgi:predicted MFS family arabinose efflux permease